MAQNCHNNFMTVLLTINILKVVLLQTHMCKLGFKEGKKSTLADCSSLNLRTVPQNLPSNIHTMNISYNGLLRISKDDLKRYELLKAFIFFGLRVGNDIPSYIHITEDAFSNKYLKKIIDIQFDFVSIGGPNVKLKLPPSLKKLRFTASNLISENLEIHRCKRLEVVVLRDNILTDLPRFYKYAPISYLDVLNNNISMILPEEISGYCHLNKFMFNITPDMSLLKRYCPCMQLKKWLIVRKIKGYESDNLVCRPDKRCKNSSITTEMRKNYYQCWESNRSYNDGDDGSIFFDQVLFFFLLVSVIFFVLIFASLTIIISMTKKKVKSKFEKKDLIPNTSTTSPQLQEVEQSEEIEEELSNSVELERTTEATSQDSLTVESKGLYTEMDFG